MGVQESVITYDGLNNMDCINSGGSGAGSNPLIVSLTTHVEVEMG